MVVAGSGDIDVHMVSHDYVGKGLTKPRRADIGAKRAAVGWAMATLGLAGLTSLLVATRQSHDLPLDVLAFLALTVACAWSVGCGQHCSVP